jgi:hypothetical protein
VQLGLLQLLYPNAHFIHARRHPIDTSLSVYMRPFLGVNELGNTRRKIVGDRCCRRAGSLRWITS